MENIESLREGQIFKNYKELARFLYEDVKTGRSKELQIKDWERFFTYRKDGFKFIIEEIYSEPRPKIDNRGKSEGSRGNNMTYGKYIDLELISSLKDIGQKEKSLYKSAKQIAQMIGMVNCNYPDASLDIDKYVDYITYEFGFGLNIKAVWVVFDAIKSSINEGIRSSLERLAKNNLIDFNETYILIHDNMLRLATGLEEKTIEDIEKKVQEKMGIVKKTKLQFSAQKRRKFYGKVTNRAQQEIKCLDSMFRGYKICLTPNLFKEEGYEEGNKIILNTLFIESLKKRMKEKNLKNIKKIIIGEPESASINKNYLTTAEYIINSLCSLDYKDIRSELSKPIES